MRRQSVDTSILEWVSILSFAAIAVFIAYELVGYSTQREELPPNMSLAGVPVGGLTVVEAAARVQSVYETPLELYYGEHVIQLSPAQISFALDMEVMMARAETYRTTSSWWGGFWNYLWRIPGQGVDVQLAARYSAPQLRTFLEDVATRYDQPPTEPVGITGTLQYTPGQPGYFLDVDSSQAVIDAAIQAPNNRRAVLTVRSSEAAAPTLGTLRELLQATMDRRQFTGIYSIVVIDLQTGEEIAINPDVAYAGMSMLKIPIVIETYRMLDSAPLPDTEKLLVETIELSGNFTANLLLREIGQGSEAQGATVITERMREMGLINTFMATPYDQSGPYPEIQTPANQRTDLFTTPDRGMQTTPGDMATLLMWLYQCAELGDGALVMMYGAEITQQECNAIVELMMRGDIRIMLEEGLPEGILMAQKHGFGISDTHGNIGIVYTPGGDYVIAMYLYKETFLEWEVSSPLFVEVSAAVYRYFNP